MSDLLTRDPELRFYRCKYPESDKRIPNDLYLVAHSLECDDKVGIAWSLVTGWLQDEQASVHTVTDRTGTTQSFDYDATAWHCGGGNQHGSGHEIVGRASWSVEQWNTATMDQAMRHQARAMARKWVLRTMPKLGISYKPEWLSLAQIAEGVLAGLVTHNDMRLVFGGTTHTDPGPNFPYKKLRDYIHAEIDVLLGNAPTLKPPATTPAAPAAPQAPQEEDDMYSPDDRARDRQAAAQAAQAAQDVAALKAAVAALKANPPASALLFRNFNGGVGIADLPSQTWRGLTSPAQLAIVSTVVPSHKNLAALTAAQVKTAFGVQVA